MNDQVFDVIIIGSGPAGLTAGIYALRAARKTLIVAGRVWGGQLMLTTLVENYPGFPAGIQGPDLMTAMRKQTEAQGAQFVDVDLKSTDFSRSPSADGSGKDKKPLEVTTDDGKVYTGRSVIIATGANTKWLDIPGEKEKIGRGVSSCAPCDAAFYRNKKVLVVGGGDSAMEEALVLTKFATHVYVVHRRSSLKASAAMQKKAYENPKITFIWNSAITEILGDQKVEKVRIESRIMNQESRVKVRIENQEKEMSIEELGGQLVFANDQKPKTDDAFAWQMRIDGVFVAIGHIPNSEVFKGIDVDEKGFIKVYDHTKTNVDGVFVAGDVHDAEYKQAVTAAGFGCMASLEVEKYLENLPLA